MTSQRADNLGQFLGVESHERALVGRVFLQAILVGMQNLFTRTAVFAIFLETFAASELPVVYIAAGLIIPILGTVFSRYETSHNNLKAYKLSLYLTLFMLVGMRLSLTVEAAGNIAVFALPIFYLATFRFLSIVLWGTANTVFTLRQSKRLYGLITTGDKITTLAGGLLIPVMIPALGTENLILISIAAVLIANFNQSRILKTGNPSTSEAEPSRANNDDSLALPEDEQSTYGRYVKLVLIIQAGLSAMYFSIDNAFLAEVKNHYPTADSLASFLGYTAAATALGSIVLGAISARTIAERFGTMSMLQLTPWTVLVLGLGATLVAVSFPNTVWVLVALTVIRVTERSLTPSVFYPSFYALFHPLPKNMGSRFQNFSLTVSGPLAGAGIGALLLFINSITTPNAALLCALVALTGLATIIVSRLAARLYPKILAFAVGSQRIHHVELGLSEGQSLDLLENGLQSERAEEVIYCLDLLLQIRPERVRNRYHVLLTHSQSAVRRHVAQAMARDLQAQASDKLLAALEIEDAPAVKATILHSIASVDAERCHEIISPYLESSHPVVLMAALVAMIKHGGLRSIIAAGTRLQSLENSSDPTERALAARVIGEIQNASFYHGLETLLGDAHLVVRQAALKATGLLAAPQLLPHTLKALEDPQLETLAIEALRQCGESAIHTLLQAYNDPEQSFRIRRHILVLLGSMASGGSVRALFGRLDDGFVELDQEILYALRASAKTRSNLEAGPEQLDTVHKLVNREGKRAIAMLQALHTYASVSMPGGVLLRETLQHEFERVIERMLLTASLLTPSLPFRRMYESIYLGRKKDIAFYCELLEQNLPSRFSKRLVPLVEPLDLETKVLKLSQIYDHPLADPLSNLASMADGQFASHSPWLAVCAKRFMNELTHSSNPNVGRDLMDSEVLTSRVRNLQKIDFFSSCSAAMLAECVRSFQVRELAPGEILVAKGQPQYSLCVLESGHLESLDTTYEAGDHFGHEALVGAELVHEEVLAVAPSRVMVLGREDFMLLLLHSLPLYISVLESLCIKVTQALQDRPKLAPQESSGNSAQELTDLDSFMEQEILLKNCDLFKAIDRTGLQHLMVAARVRRLARGESLYQRGERNEFFYLVSSGSIELQIDQCCKARLGRGDGFGKYRFLGTPQPMPTHAISATGATVLEIDGAAIDAWLWESRAHIEATIAYLLNQKRALSPQLVDFTWF